MDKQSSFFISGVISFTIYFVIIIFLIYEIKIPKYSQKAKVQNVEINLEFFEPELLKPEPIKDNLEKSEIVKKIQTKKVAKKSRSLSSLFEDINVSVDEKTLLEKDINLKNYRKKIELKKSKSIVFKDIFNKEKRLSVPKEISKVSMKSKSSSFNQTSDLYNEYYAMVQEKLAEKWIPHFDDEGKYALLQFKIKSDGSFEFYIKKATGDSRFLERLKSHVNELKVAGFSAPSKPLTINVNFYAKGEK